MFFQHLIARTNTEVNDSFELALVLILFIGSIVTVFTERNSLSTTQLKALCNGADDVTIMLNALLADNTEDNTESNRDAGFSHVLTKGC